MNTARNPNIKVESVTAMTDGVEIDYIENGKTKNKVVPHGEFRPWTFKQGYWINSYYEFLNNMQSEIVAHRFLTEKMQQTCSTY